MQYYPPFAPVLTPAQEEHRALLHEGNFLGTGMLLLLVLQQVLATTVITLLALFGFTDLQTALSDQYWGLGHTAFLFVYMGVYTVMMGAPLWFAAACFRVRRNPFGMHARVRPTVFIAAVLIGLGGCVLANLLTGIWTNIWSMFGFELQNIDVYTEPSAQSLLLNLATFAVLPALLEEMVFRGFVLQGLRGLGDPAAIVLSALLFGLMHINLLQLPFAFLLGLLMGYLVVKTGNIWVAVVIHFLNNALCVTMDYAGQFISEAEVGWLTTLILTLLAVVGILVMAVLVARRSSLITFLETTRSALLPHERMRALVGAPCMWIAIAVLAAMTLLVSLMDAVAATMG